jgi:hypothetical protein
MAGSGKEHKNMFSVISQHLVQSAMTLALKLCAVAPEE